MHLKTELFNTSPGMSEPNFIIIKKEQLLLPAHEEDKNNICDDEEEKKPKTRWLNGLPHWHILERCKKLTELSKQLKYFKHDDRIDSNDRQT